LKDVAMCVFDPAKGCPYGQEIQTTGRIDSEAHMVEEAVFVDIVN
jgi:hypothetical protein